MKFWIISTLLYAAALAGGLILPGVVIAQRAPLGWDHIGLYMLALALMAAGGFLVVLMFAKVVYPDYWWAAQVEAKDVFAFDGVYFEGLRLSRVPNRVQRMVFGVDEQMRRWDLAFGMLFLLLLLVHVMGFATAYQTYDRTFPQRPRFPESLQQPLLSTLPVTEQLGGAWSQGSEFAARVNGALEKLRFERNPTNAQRFERAQLYLLRAFAGRVNAGDPYVESPGEQVYFNRGDGARAVEQLNLLLGKPALKRAGWDGGALALVGFFHLSDRSYAKAREFLEKSLARLSDGEESRISRWQVQLMAAQTALQSGNEDAAVQYLEAVLTNERLPQLAYALAWEQLAEALRLTGDTTKPQQMLQKAKEMYQAASDRGGLARVHVRLSALALAQGHAKEASRELSEASRLAHGAEDGFTLNMVDRISRAFSG